MPQYVDFPYHPQFWGESELFFCLLVFGLHAVEQSFKCICAVCLSQSSTQSSDSPVAYWLPRVRQRSMLFGVWNTPSLRFKSTSDCFIQNNSKCSRFQEQCCCSFIYSYATFTSWLCYSLSLRFLFVVKGWNRLLCYAWYHLKSLD